MRNGIRYRRRDLVAAACAVLAFVLLVLGVLSLGAAQPYEPLAGLARELALGACLSGAALVAVVARSRTTAWFFSLATVALALGASGLSLRATTVLWVPCLALAASAGPLVVAAALGVIRGAVGVRMVRAAVVAAAGAAAIQGAIVLLTFDPGTWSWCSCVANPAAGLGVTPSGFLSVARWVSLGWVIAAVLLLVAVARGFLVTRDREGRAAVMLAGLSALAIGWLMAGWGTLTTGVLDQPSANLVSEIGMATAAVGTAFLLVSRRGSRAKVADLLVAARSGRSPTQLQALVRQALGDHQAAVLRWDQDARCYVDHDGLPVLEASIETAEDRRLVVIAAETEPLAALDVDDAVATDRPDVLESVVEALRLAGENAQLSRALSQTLEDVRESRARIVTASDEARRRVERDLHDGAQQLLVSAGLTVKVARDRAANTDPEIEGLLRTASQQLARAHTELRELSSGLVPAGLIHAGLPEAVRELALRSPVPARVDVVGEARLSPLAASTLYFVAAESLTNVGKHAQAAKVRISLELGNPARLTVADDGVGIQGNAGGSGLRGLADRVESVGGRFTVTSSDVDGGTTVEAVVPAEAGTT